MIELFRFLEQWPPGWYIYLVVLWGCAIHYCRTRYSQNKKTYQVPGSNSCFLFFPPSHCISSPFVILLPPTPITQIRGHTLVSVVGSSSIPTRGRDAPCIVIARRLSTFPPHQPAPDCAYPRYVPDCAYPRYTSYMYNIQALSTLAVN